MYDFASICSSVISCPTRLSSLCRCQHIGGDYVPELSKLCQPFPRYKLSKVAHFLHFILFTHQQKLPQNKNMLLDCRQIWHTFKGCKARHGTKFGLKILKQRLKSCQKREHTLVANTTFNKMAALCFKKCLYLQPLYQT